MPDLRELDAVDRGRPRDARLAEERGSNPQRVGDLGRRLASHARQIGAGERLREVVALLERDGRRGDRDGTARAALDDGALEQALARRHHELRTHAGPTGGLTENSDVVRIAAERADVLLHPSKRRLLVEETVRRRRRLLRFGSQRGVPEEPEGSEAVVERDDERAHGREVHAFVRALAAGPEHEPATMDEDHHRRGLAGHGERRPHVEKQTVLDGVARGLARDQVHLRTDMPVRLRGFRTAPRGRVRRRLPAQITDGRRRVRDPKERAGRVELRPLDGALVGRDDRGPGGSATVGRGRGRGAATEHREKEWQGPAGVHGAGGSPRFQMRVKARRRRVRRESRSKDSAGWEPECYGLGLPCPSIRAEVSLPSLVPSAWR